MEDVCAAIAALERGGCKEIAILHCVSLYPPKDENVNLNNMDMYKKVFDYPVGYSDHTLGTIAPIMSIAKGACIIEKHFTMDKNMEGWDHKVSANPEELKVICDAAREGYAMLGSYRKVVVEDENRREEFKRSIVAKYDMPAGHVLTLEDLAYKRPGTGISPKHYEMVIGRALKHDVKYDDIFQWEDLV